MRAKFECQSVQEFKGGSQQVQLTPVSGGCEENKSFAQHTPGGHLDLFISNPDAYGFFKPGKEYYLDMTPVETVSVEVTGLIESE